MRQVFDLPVVCPAGERIAESTGGSGCRCRIEQNTLTSHADAYTVRNYCYKDYRSCPTWRAHKQAIWERRERQFEREIAA